MLAFLKPNKRRRRKKWRGKTKQTATDCLLFFVCVNYGEYYGLQVTVTTIMSTKAVENYLRKKACLIIMYIQQSGLTRL